MIKVTKSGTKTTVNFSYTAPTVKINKVLNDAAHYLWQEVTDENGVVINPFSGATNAEKLAVVDKHIKAVILNLAKTHKSQTAQKTAREHAELDAQTEYEL